MGLQLNYTSTVQFDNIIPNQYWLNGQSTRAWNSNLLLPSEHQRCVQYVHPQVLSLHPSHHVVQFSRDHVHHLASCCPHAEVFPLNRLYLHPLVVGHIHLSKLLDIPTWRKHPLLMIEYCWYPMNQLGLNAPNSWSTLLLRSGPLSKLHHLPIVRFSPVELWLQASYFSLHSN